MKSIRRVTEWAVNAAVVVGAIWLGYSFLHGAAGKRPSAPPALEVGSYISIEGVDFGESQRNLVLVLSTSCRFCAESVAFYQRLASSRLTGKSNDIRLIGAFVQDVEVANRFLRERDLSLDAVVKIEHPDALASSTPTLILVDSAGKVVDSWSGRLRAEREQEVFSALNLDPAT